ncbi:transcription factor [Ganoderma sinense ZZ0214-1]|uniref:Transcription factor n=1 Tax=Ganoderma sinense ZZ0214-1 TaxID=1077348 RepID=A0A2G8SRE1_9APHY|nr:transcription factor [Ganoderma sinense ZZ0214-1]
MVASSNGDLYTPFPHMPIIEEGVQSSEEGSDLHSPIFDAPYATPDARYHLDHYAYSDVSTQLLPPPTSAFDARYSAPTVDPHSRDPHILETLQVPSPTTIHHHLPPSHPLPDLALHGHPMLDLGISSSRFHPAVMNAATEYSMHLSQPSRIPEQQVRLSGDAVQSFPSRQPTTMIVAESKPQISLPSAAGPVRSNPSGSNPASTRPPRREASTVVIACRQCRARKIRCDSTRPFCHNCLRRNNECEYDAVPKRRGPDKRPGTRQRSCKKRPPDAEPTSASAKKKRKTNADGESGVLSFDVKVKENVTGGHRRGQLSSRGAMDDMNALNIPPPQGQLYINTSIPPRGTGPEAIYPKDGLSPSFHRSSVIMDYSDSNHSFARPVDVNVSQPLEDQDNLSYIPLSSPLEGASSWWDELLDQYNPTSREQSMQDIISDLTFLFTTSSYWLSFINVPLFFRDLHQPDLRSRMQSLVMSALAMALLMKSSEIELGRRGRELALTFRNKAQACLEDACHSQTFDHTLAEAALILALFESSCHPMYSPEQAIGALQLLDRIVHVLSLYSVDRDDPCANIFAARSVPIVYVHDGYQRPDSCSCSSYSTPLGSPGPLPIDAPWDPHWDDTEIRREECRRLCWCALTLVSAYTAHCSAFHTEPVELSLAEPSNYVLLFPGEACERTPGHQQADGRSPKESIWALYCRSMLLWNSCSCVQRDESLTTEERASFAIGAFQETREIQDALDMHVCNLDTGLMYVCREYLYNTRMTITYELRRLQDGDIPVLPPIFNRRQAEEWLLYQDQVAQRVKEAVLHVGETQGQLLTRRPFQVTWFSSQVAICLGLWEFNPELMHALELAKSFFIPLDVLNALWPCPGQRTKRDELRRRLENACLSAGLHPPLPEDLTLPPILRRNPRSAI